MPETNKRKQGNPARRYMWSLIAVALLVVGAVALAWPPQDKINQGLDIQGGLSVVLSAKAENGEAVTPEDMEKSKAIIEQRVNALGASEASVQIQGDDQILVQIPGLSDSSQALATIGKTGVLEFARLDSFTNEEVRNNIDMGNIYDYEAQESADGKTTPALDGLNGSSKYYQTEGGTTFALGQTSAEDIPHIKVEEGSYTPMFTGDHITQVTIGRESEGSAFYSVDVTLDGEASQAFADASRELVTDHGKIVIIIDGTVNSAPAVQSVIDQGRVSITGNYTMDDAKALQTVLDSGSLPVSFEYEQSQTVGPTLGQEELQAGIISMLLGLLLVMLYLIVFYRGFGTITAVNMLIFALVYLGVLAGLSLLGVFSLSLAGIAGIILSIGMAADSSILVIERFKEELKEGRTLKAASMSGVKHAIITSIDADVVSILSAGALFFFASSSVKGFGLTLALGILCDILVMLMFKAPVVRLLAPRAMRRNPGFWGLKQAIALGDVRTGSDNLPYAGQVAEEIRQRKEQQRKRKEKERKAAEAQKKHQREIEEQNKKKQQEQKEREKKRAEEARKKAEEEKKAAEDEVQAIEEGNAPSEDESKTSEADVREDADVAEAGGEEKDSEDAKPDNEPEIPEETAGGQGAEEPADDDAEDAKSGREHSDAQIADIIASVSEINNVTSEADDESADMEAEPDDGADDESGQGDADAGQPDGDEEAPAEEPGTEPALKPIVPAAPKPVVPAAPKPPKAPKAPVAPTKPESVS